MTRQIFSIMLTLLISQSIFADPKAVEGHQAMAANTANRLYGKVVTTMDAGGYTYVQIDTGEKKHWAAGPKAKLKKGAMVAFDSKMPFTDFQSKALNRKFKKIYFVSRFISDQPGQAAPVSNPHVGLKKSFKAEVIKGIKKAQDGKTVAEVFKQKQSLAGKAVKIRGKVVKYTAQVMGKNWLHIQDSSGTKKLVVTTEQEAKKGDLVLINGIVAVDLDLGYGYTYEVIVERAIITVE